MKSIHIEINKDNLGCAAETYAKMTDEERAAMLALLILRHTAAAIQILSKMFGVDVANEAGGDK